MRPPHKVRVLMAEDDYLVGKMIRGMLEKIGYTIVGEATDGTEALSLVQALRPDVVLMDIKMPDMDGIEATRRIQECCPTPVVVMTAFDRQELVERATEAGVGAYLVKPPNAPEIERAVTVAMARFRDMQELRRLNAELQKALAEVKQLSGLLPICSSCKKIRDDEGYWHQVEVYIRDHTDADFSHGLCPDCAQKLYPDFFAEETE
ncbi:MAG: response regulator [Caldilineae bacterium]|nr:MAG: response regulator [Caldilineae bacterium]